MKFWPSLPITKPTAPPAAPPWVDPATLMQLTAVRVATVTLLASTVTLLAKADPKRVALGFGIGSGGGATPTVGPVAAPTSAGWVLTTNVTGNWFDLFRFGPLVAMAWNGFTTVPMPVTVFEVYRQF